MLKVVTIIGTRPEIIKMSRIISLFDKFTNHTLVHTGQNYDYELNEIFFDDLELRKPDYFLNAAKKNSVLTIASVIAKSDEIFEKVKPDALLVYGDTNSCLSVIAAKKRQIPIFHMEAGNRCFDIRVPEETNRKIVDHLSDINIVLSEHARRYLIAEGIRPETIFKSGSHLKEVINYFMPKIKKSRILSRLRLKSKQYFLVSMHREENIEKAQNFSDILEALNAIADNYKYPIIVTTHPRTQKKLLNYKSIEFNKNILFLKPFGFTDYLFLQMNALCIISDSGTISEEASILKLPAITIRNTHERPEAIDSGIFIMSGLKRNKILDAINFTINQFSSKKNIQESVNDYECNSVSSKILKIVLSYEHYINRYIWHK